MSRIFIIGGHGKVARLLTPLLVAQGHQVTAMIRAHDQADTVRTDGARPLVLDVAQATLPALAQALSDHDAVVWSAGAGGGDAARTAAVDREGAIASMKAAGQAGVRRYVMVSYITSGRDTHLTPDDPFYAYARAKADADAALRASALDWTILGPGRLTDAAASGRIARIAPQALDQDHADTARGNVAAVIAAVLAAPRTIHQTLDFVDGPTPIAEALAAAP